MWSRELKKVVLSGCSDADNCDISEENILPMYDHVCSIDEVLTVHCSGKRYTVKEFAILANPTGERGDWTRDFSKYATNAGSLVVYLHDVRTDKTMTSLVKTPSFTSTYFSYAVSAICKKQGYYRGGTSNKHAAVTYKDRLSVGFMEENQIGTMVHTMSCTSRRIREPLRDCEFGVIEGEFDPEQSVVTLKKFWGGPAPKKSYAIGQNQGTFSFFLAFLAFFSLF
eukprot:sb/3469668/